MKFVISQELLEKILNYLAAQPYIHVAPLIEAIKTTCVPLAEEKSEVVKEQ